MRYTVEPDGDELSEISALIAAGKSPTRHVEKSFPTGASDGPHLHRSSAGRVVLAVS